MNILLKVDIASRRILVNNLEDFYTRQAMGEGRQDPEWHNNPAIHQTQLSPRELWELQLFNRICAFQKKRRKNKKWTVHKLFRLALLVDAKNCYIEIAGQLGNPVRSCKSMYNSMKKAGVV